MPKKVRDEDKAVFLGSDNIFRDLDLQNPDELLFFAAECIDVPCLTAQELKSRISVDPNKRGGKPCISGTRITVGDVMSYLASGMTIEQLLEDFPTLSLEDIRACFAYCSDQD